MTTGLRPLAHVASCALRAALAGAGRRWLRMAGPACALLCAACTETADKNVLAQVGDERLTAQEVRLLVPMHVTGRDSLAFVRQYVDEWVDDQLFYAQGLRRLPNLKELEAQVADYRRRLIAQSYENELLSVRVGEASDDECAQYYEAHRQEFAAPTPLVKGVFVKLLGNSSKADVIKRWLGELAEGKTDCFDDLETYCQQHAVGYDNFYDQWIELQRLCDQLPAAAQAPALATRAYEQRDADYVYLWALSEVCPAGQTQPFDYVVGDVRERLNQGRRTAFRQQLQHDLRREGEQTGFVKVNVK